MRESPTRRRLLRSTAIAGLAATAGCISSGNQASQETQTPTDEPTTTATETTDEQTETATETQTKATDLPEPDSLDSWLAEANGYDGGEIPRSAGPTTSVWVGHPTDDGLAFDPPVVEIMPRTAVRWDWSDHGGQRNVVALDGTFDSGRTNGQSGTSYRWFFEETGVYPYVSEPHIGEGMRGAIVVKEPPTTGYETVDEWVLDSSNFDGEVADETGTDETAVTVGATGNGGSFAFDPPVLKVSPGTTVAWEWTGDGTHNVAFRDMDLKSGDPVPEAGVHFEHTFEERGTYLYNCEPHRALGMKGAVIVE